MLRESVYYFPMCMQLYGGIDTIGFLAPPSFSAVPKYDLPPELWNKNMVQLAPVPPGTDIWVQTWLSSLSITCTREIPHYS